LAIAQPLEMKPLIARIVGLRADLQGVTHSTTSIDAVAASIDAERPDLTSQSAPDGTVTLLFSDIENSTARTAELGDAKWIELLREHNTIVRDQLAAHGGYEVKSMGDGFMLAFGSALDGLRCAVGMQRAFAARNTQADETIRVRIGLHTGEAIKEADDFFGSHVNLAARVGGAAHGDEILVSGLLKALTESAGEFTFDGGREVELKGISGSPRVHAVEWR
jgi:class 3 adenylate cyclase